MEIRCWERKTQITMEEKWRIGNWSKRMKHGNMEKLATERLVVYDETACLTDLTRSSGS